MKTTTSWLPFQRKLLTCGNFKNPLPLENPLLLVIVRSLANLDGASTFTDISQTVLEHHRSSTPSTSVSNVHHYIKTATCFLAGRGEDCGTGEGDSIGLLAPDPDDPPAIVVLSDVVASDG